MRYFFLTSIFLLLCIPNMVYAKGFVPFQFAFIEPLQLFDEDVSVVGLRINLFLGANREVYGLDVGLANFVKDASAGLTTGALNISDTHVGLQTGIGNGVDNIYGLQAGVVNYSKALYGWQLGAINIGGERAWLPMVGVLVNASNDAKLGQYSVGSNQAGDSVLQLAGILNNAKDSYLQVTGGLNFVDDGFLQIAGMGNIADDNSYLQISLGSNTSLRSNWYQFAGLINYTSRTSYFQNAIFYNNAKRAIVQLSVLGNKTPEGTLQIAGAINHAKSSDIQIAGIYNFATQTKWQLALSNSAELSATQVGVVNYASATTGQLGLLNLAAQGKGISIGLVNDTEKLDGYQVGLINVARNATFPVTLFYNYNLGLGRENKKTGFFNTEQSFLQLGIYEPAQLFEISVPITGFRFNFFFTQNIAVYGADLGFYNRSDIVKGVELSAISQVTTEVQGLMVSGISATGGDFTGVELGLVSLHVSKFTGLGITGVSFTSKDVDGLQVSALANISLGEVQLLQLGTGVNAAEKVPLQLGGIGNFAKQDLWGPQLSLGGNIAGNCSFLQIGAGNYTKKKVKFFQTGALFNYATFAPLQVAGLLNWAKREAWFQFAGISNVVTENIRTAPFSRGADPIVQASLFFNLSEDTHLQISAFNFELGRNYTQIGVLNILSKGYVELGAVNILYSKMRGVQLGLVNANLGKIKGVQLGLINANNDIKGFSAGLWNVADDSRGLTIGLFNLADELEGVQIGLININRKGDWPITIGVNYSAWGDDDPHD
ncbi:MAG: hypothetical protein AAF518_07605 [Spirochaetota bacterium]